ncbi:MAG TPA: choline dehydrogenase [Rugosimonospora sp.]|nr:choline dehydrogenase [Rugosimonospora sp.]
MSTGAEFDYIVVGAGPAGCVLAARLSEDPGVRVLLVEAGGPARGLSVSMPAALPFAYQRTALQWGYTSGPEPHLDGRTLDEKAGRAIGGSSAINAMLYNRGNPMDYDSWAELGLPEWSYAHCLPYFRRMETFAGGPDEWRGGDGPLRISRCPAAHKLHDAFLRSGEQAGYGVTADHNGYRQEGMHVAQAFIHNGLRWNAARAYLRPALARPNLTVRTGTLVARVLVAGGVATGIAVADGRTIGCAREVVLCAGAYNSPKLLLLSGIGDADELRRHGIDSVAHVPEVGRNLQNHPGIDVQFATRPEDSLAGRLGLVGRATLGARWLLTRTGPGASNYFESGAFLRSRADAGYPNLQYEFLPLTRLVRDGRLVPVPGFQFWLDVCRPGSRGAVGLRSADPAEPPSIVFNHLAAPQDVRDLIDGVRLARDLVSRPAWHGYRREELAPGSAVASDAELEAYLRARTTSSYHASGTCRMGADGGAVVDAEGRVTAVCGLRVVDASILPRIVAGNLNAPVLMLAEKLADRIRGRPPLPPSTAPYHRDSPRRA